MATLPPFLLHQLESAGHDSALISPTTPSPSVLSARNVVDGAAQSADARADQGALAHIVIGGRTDGSATGGAGTRADESAASRRHQCREGQRDHKDHASHLPHTSVHVLLLRPRKAMSLSAVH